MAIIPARKPSYYDEEETKAPEQHAPRETNPEGTEGMLSAVIPTSLLKGQPFEVGDKVVLKIDSIQGDQLVVSYAEAEGEEMAEMKESMGNEAMSPEGEPTEVASEAGDMMYD